MTIAMDEWPYKQKSKREILADLEKSRKQISEGKGIDMKQALREMGTKHGFIKPI